MGTGKRAAWKSQGTKTGKVARKRRKTCRQVSCVYFGTLGKEKKKMSQNGKRATRASMTRRILGALEEEPSRIKPAAGCECGVCFDEVNAAESGVASEGGLRRISKAVRQGMFSPGGNYPGPSISTCRPNTRVVCSKAKPLANACQFLFGRGQRDTHLPDSPSAASKVTPLPVPVPDPMQSRTEKCRVDFD
jgi:hypothetical protein